MYICICLNQARTTVHSSARYTILKVSDSSKHRRGRVGGGLHTLVSLVCKERLEPGVSFFHLLGGN